MAKRAVKKKEIEEDYTSQYNHDDDEEGMLYIAPYVDSLYGTRLELRTDGRKRGLWVWLEEDINARMRADRRILDEGIEKLIPKLEELFKREDKQMLKFELLMYLRLYLGFFFDHRTEGQAVRLTWKQVKQLEAKLKSGYANEKHKTEEDY